MYVYARHAFGFCPNWGIHGKVEKMRKMLEDEKAFALTKSICETGRLLLLAQTLQVHQLEVPALL